MNKIKILPDEIINHIAAGEVLDRPSSAVKELVENSIDANSKKISIFVRDGGKTEIVITDDGEGISNQELELAITRHATSKLNEKVIGSLMMFLFLETIFSCYFMNVDPFDQPAVEEGKILTKQFLENE